tara:strand:- start:54 stop:347 length:294 start_codon:yes stop_codon:yes gene_type:complete
MIRKAQELVDIWRQIDSHLELTPRQIVYLCVYAKGEKLGPCNVAARMNVTIERVRNHVHRLAIEGWLDHVKYGTYMISSKGLKLIQKLFPQTYPQEV